MRQNQSRAALHVDAVYRDAASVAARFWIEVAKAKPAEQLAMFGAFARRVIREADSGRWTLAEAGRALQDVDMLTNLIKTGDFIVMSSLAGNLADSWYFDSPDSLESIWENISELLVKYTS